MSDVEYGTHWYWKIYRWLSADFLPVVTRHFASDNRLSADIPADQKVWWQPVVSRPRHEIIRVHPPPPGSRGVHGVQGNPPPRPPFLNILWKWNDLVSVRPNYFIFMGFLRKWDKISKANPHTFMHMKPLSRNPRSAPGQLKSQVFSMCHGEGSNQTGWSESSLCAKPNCWLKVLSSTCSQTSYFTKWKTFFIRTLRAARNKSAL